MTTQPPTAWPPPPPPIVALGAPARGLSIAALVCGITAASLGALWPISIPLGVVAAVLGLVARHERKAVAAPRPMALWGTWLGVAAVVFGALSYAATVAVVNVVDREVQEYNEELDDLDAQLQEDLDLTDQEMQQYLDDVDDEMQQYLDEMAP